MRVLILGAGLSGQGAALLMQQKGHDVTLVNRGSFNSQEFEALGIHCVYNDDVSVNDGSYEVFIKAPGIPDRHPLVQSFKGFTNEIEWAWKYSQDYKYYCISGTNGKTTATTLLHEMLLKRDEHALLAGNVGVALSQKVYEDGNYQRDVALEISGFQIDGLIDFQAEVFGLLNLSPDHLDHYDTVEQYYQSKLNLIKQSKVFIRNCDDANIFALTSSDENVLDLSLQTKADIWNDDGTIRFREIALFDIDKLNLPGTHNIYNASMAAAIAYLAGVTPYQIQDVISKFKAVVHRNEYVDTIEGITYYNDSKATNPEGVSVCLNSFDQPVILLAGGYDKKISFDILKQDVDKVKHAFLFGESKEALGEIFPNHQLVDTMETAFNLATSMAQSGDIIVLSPACASYDQFKSFEDRGDQFKAMVAKMKV